MVTKISQTTIQSVTITHEDVAALIDIVRFARGYLNEHPIETDVRLTGTEKDNIKGLIVTLTKLLGFPE